MGTPRPSRCSACVRVALTSRFNMSPNSYGLLTASASMPVARCSVSCAPKLDFPIEPSRCLSVRYPRKSIPFSEVELDLLGGLLRHPAGAEQGLLARRQLGRFGDVEVALLDQLLHDLVEQLGELALEVGV